MNAQTPEPRHSRRSRPWGLIAVSTGFLAAAASVVAVGLISLGLVPSLQ
ncbi:hypothetical protein [Kocuria rosea]|nr:hypothetical protein [Kocuria rosea]WJZ68401.1 hypothetical protein QR564_17625 [Kocuria rosea]